MLLNVPPLLLPVPKRQFSGSKLKTTMLNGHTHTETAELGAGCRDVRAAGLQPGKSWRKQ